MRTIRLLPHLRKQAEEVPANVKVLLALDHELEHYQDAHHRFLVLSSKWKNAAGDQERFRVAEDVEQFAAEELRSFLRTHEKAQFLL